MAATRSRSVSEVSEDDSEAVKRVKVELSPGDGEADELTSATEETVHDRYTEGDCTLVSSDKTLFKINGYHLQAASVRLGALESPITFAPDDGVTNDILALFLDYVRYRPTQPVDTTSLPKIRRVLQFAAEWECTGVVRSILSDVLRGAISNRQLNPADLFDIAAQYDEPTLARFAITARCQIWKTPENDDFPTILKDRYGCTVMDPRTWSLDTFARIAPLYSWAYQRALLGSNLDKMTDYRWEEVARRFEQLLEIGRKDEYRTK